MIDLVSMTRKLLFSSFALIVASCQNASAGKDEPQNVPSAQQAVVETVIIVEPVTDVASVEDKVVIQDWATDLKEPWGVHFIANNTALVTEKRGKLWQVSPGEKLEINGIPASVDRGQGGLLDVATDPDFADNGWIYLSFSHADADNRKKLMTKIVRGKIESGQWSEEQTLFQAKAEDYLDSRHHFGSRITFDDKGHLYFGIGDRGKMDMAQDLTVPNGKIHRIMRDGSIPKITLLWVSKALILQFIAMATVIRRAQLCILKQECFGKRNMAPKAGMSLTSSRLA